MQPLGRYPLEDLRDAAAARGRTCLFDTVHDFASTGSGANFRLVTSGVAFGGIRLSAVATTGHRIALTDEDHATLLLPLRGRIGTDDGRTAQEATPTVMLMPRPGRRDTSTAPGYLGLVAQIPRRRLDAALAEAGRGGEWPWPAILPALQGAGAAIRRHLLRIVAEFDHGTPPFAGSARAAEMAADQLCAMLASPLGRAEEPSGGTLRALAPAARQVRLAEAFMETHAAEPLSLARLAAAAGTGERSLQLVFRAVRGCSPRRVLAAMRLDQARELLLSGGRTPASPTSPWRPATAISAASPPPTAPASARARPTR